MTRILTLVVFTLTSASAQQPAVREWRFDNWNDREGWTVSDRLTGVAAGGSLWLTLTPAVRDPTKLADPAYQVYGDSRFGESQRWHEVTSPAGLGIDAATVKKVRLRVLNLSPWTDGYIAWRTREQPEKTAGAVRFTLKADLNRWQQLVCHVDTRWNGTIDQVAVRIPTTRIRGDIWIDHIEITGGEPLAPAQRPDVASDQAVPRVRIPGIRQTDFHDAFKVLDECLIVNTPVHGFTYPVMGPGGAYGENWWQLDSSLNLAGAMWANQAFAEDVMRGFRDVQADNPDGRIDLYGGSAMRGQVGDQSSIPRYFEVAWDTARRTVDAKLRLEIYETMRRYLDWWLSPVKRDARTGLITAIFEETTSELDAVSMRPQTVAAVDLNVAVAFACQATATLARHLRRKEEAARYERSLEEIKTAINRYLWDEERGAYYNYDVREQRLRPRLICTTFDPLRLGIAPLERRERLLKKLVDPALFNWGTLPLTTIARTEPTFVEAKGPYDGRAWGGDVWTLRNLFVVAGLKDTGSHDLAAELSWATIKAFNANYTEYLVPSTGEGHGVKRYGWSASQYIQAVIEYLFGVDYDRLEGRVRIFPHIPEELYTKALALEGLILPTGGRLNLRLTQWSPGAADIEVNFSGALPTERIEIFVPQAGERPATAIDARGTPLPLWKEAPGLLNATCVRVAAARSVSVKFR